MSDLTTTLNLTTNNYKKCETYRGGYCVQCYEYKNRYYWPLDTLTCVDGSAMCANCLTEKIIPAIYFVGYTKRQIEKKLDNVRLQMGIEASLETGDIEMRLATLKRG